MWAALAHDRAASPLFVMTGVVYEYPLLEVLTT